MCRNFFQDCDDFFGIAKSHIKKVTDFHQIKTGWTNYVYRVSGEDGVFYFRFPRNSFFSDAMIKECKIVAAVKDKLSFETPNFQLCFNKGRPYTIHREIAGKSLSQCYASLSEKEKTQLAKDISRLLKDFSDIDLTSFDMEFQNVSLFLDDLSHVSKNNYDTCMHSDLKALEKQNLVFSHGDLNPGNLILRDNKLVGVIDFAFAGKSSAMTDLSRIIGRCPEEFSSILIGEYEKKFSKKIDNSEIEKLCKIWGYVEEKYILYIKQNHPSIVLPSLAVS